MRGHEVLSYLLHGGTLMLEDNYHWIYRLGESGIEAKSLDDDAYGTDRIFSWFPTSFDWLMSNDFFIPDGYNLTLEEAYWSMSRGSRCCSIDSDPFSYSIIDDSVHVFIGDEEVFSEYEFDGAELNTRWRTM